MVLVPAVFLAQCLIFFFPAGTLDYRETWVFIVFLLVPFLFGLTCPSQKISVILVRRMRSTKKIRPERDHQGLKLHFPHRFSYPGP